MDGFSLRRVPFGWLMGVFAATAVLGVWVAYDRARAGMKLANIVASIVLYYVLAGQGRRNAWRSAGALGVLGSGIAVYFLLTHNWQTWPADIALLTRIGEAWMGIRPSFPLPTIHPNIAGGLIAVLLPFQIAFGVYGYRKRRRDIWATAVILGGVALIGLALTSSRAAWLALAAALGVLLLWMVSAKAQAAINWPRRTIFIILTLLMVGLGVGVSFPLAGGPLGLAGGLPGANSATSRLDLYRQTLDLIGDFPFTGGGLAAFPGLYSQYIAVTPFFQFDYSHNLWLDIWLEQGLLGLLAFLSVMVGSGLALWRTTEPRHETPEQERRRRPFRRELNLFRWATAVGLLTMTLHGFVDDALYGGVGTPLLFALPGMAAAGARKRGAVPASFSWNSHWAWVAVAVLASVGAWRSAAVNWRSNWGAVVMTQTELQGWPTDRWDDGRNAAQLAPAKDLFQRAIQIEPENRAAQSRLGLIALLERDFETAVAHLQTAHDLDPDHRGIAKSLGYSYVWAGELEQAAVLLAAIPEAGWEMKAYVNWWNEQKRPDLAAQAMEMAAK
ncbi:MAG: tetratricopeptide repeat protein [Chloroflexi bacterium]|nr:tetratricopeptide repeat protein [Chloroflexota bacterium]